MSSIRGIPADDVGCGLQWNVVVRAVRSALPRSRKFHIDAMAAFAMVILLLAAGMGLALVRSEQVSSHQLAHVQSEEREITLVERLRWSAELFVSAERSYLIWRDPTQLANLSHAKSEFDDAVRALEGIELSPIGASYLEQVRSAAGRFRRIQEQLLTERSSGELATVVERFEVEQLPARVALRSALDQLVGHKTAVIERVYADARQARASLMRWMLVLLVTLVIGSVGVAWWSATRLARTYRGEADALETAKRALAARDELMGIIAHDLRSPLGAISMRAELLEETTRDAKTREQAGAIGNTATRMAHLIKSMLDVTVIEAGQLTVHKARCDVGSLVGEELEMISMVAASKQIQLERSVSEPGLVVLADRERVFQVLSNLLGNAIKFTPKGGRVTLAVDRAGDVVTFSVSDTGPGIAQEHLSRVFDRYWKDESRGTKGTGLGLFISRCIIEAHGGRIWVESSPGQGATFRFTLSLAVPETTSESPDRVLA